MPVLVTLDLMLATRKMTLTELSAEVGTTIANLSILKTGKAKGVSFNVLGRICDILDCQPGDLLQNISAEEYKKLYRLN
jgi:putative transcriptional regulator